MAASAITAWIAVQALVNIGAKTLSGFGYRGHSFWDTEIFMLPLFTYTAPHIARNLLHYRYLKSTGAGYDIGTEIALEPALGQPASHPRADSIATFEALIDGIPALAERFDPTAVTGAAPGSAPGCCVTSRGSAATSATGRCASTSTSRSGWSGTWAITRR